MEARGGEFAGLAGARTWGGWAGCGDRAAHEGAITGMDLLDWGRAGLLRDEGAVKIRGWVAHVQGIRGFSGDAYARERSGCSRCIDLREREEKVSRERRVSRFVIERNGALVEARLALHRRAGTVGREERRGLNQIA